MLIETLIFQFHNQKELTLLSIVNDLLKNFGVKLKRQSLNERFNKETVNYLKLLLEDAIKNLTDGFIEKKIFKPFSEVNIMDSTKFELPEVLKERFPGNGGGASMAVLNCQFEYDIKSSRIQGIELTGTKTNDYTSARNSYNRIKKDALLIRDLGYISIDILQEITRKEAFFLNRIKPTTTIYEKKKDRFVELSLKNIAKNLRKSGKPFVSKQVYIGKRQFLPCRIIFMLIPDEKYKDRLIKQKEKTRRRGSRNVDQRVLNSLDLNIFITNTEEEQLPTHKILDVYKLRWQIELVFKTWKQICEINKVRKMKADRIEITLFAQLLWIIINWSLINIFSTYFFLKTGMLLSIYKSFKTLRFLTLHIRYALRSMSKLRELLIQLQNIFSEDHFVDKRKGVRCSIDIIHMFLYK